MRAAVQDAHRAGGSIRAIAAEIHRSTRTIQNWLHHTTADNELGPTPKLGTDPEDTSPDPSSDAPENSATPPTDSK